MSTKSSDQMAGDSLEHGDDQKEGGGGMKIESIRLFYMIFAIYMLLKTGPTKLTSSLHLNFGIEFFGLKPKILIILLIWQEHMLKYSHFDLCKSN